MANLPLWRNSSLPKMVFSPHVAVNARNTPKIDRHRVKSRLSRTCCWSQTVQIVCLDLEGVLVPEIWIEFAKRTGIPELKRTTRDEPDYDKLMTYRLNILREHKLGLPDIQKVIAEMGPMDGA